MKMDSFYKWLKKRVKEKNFLMKWLKEQKKNIIRGKKTNAVVNQKAIEKKIYIK